MNKKSTVIFVLLLVCNAITVLAQPLPGISGDIELPENFLIDALQPILQKIGLFIGGIFGLYIILTFLQLYNEQKKIRLLKDIRNDLDLLTKHFGVKHSHEKRGIFKRLLGIFISDEEEPKKLKK